MPEDGRGNDVRTPVPDPTLLTTEALLREVGHARELSQSEIDRLEDRIDAYEKAHETKHRERAAEVEKAIQNLTDLAAERFAGVADRLAGIQLQLAERDLRVTESTAASKDAIAAALAAQKEAAGKSEQAFKEQIESLKAEFGTTVTSLETRIDNVKDLFSVSSGKAAGLELAVSRVFTSVTIVVSVLAVVATIILSR